MHMKKLAAVAATIALAGAATACGGEDNDTRAAPSDSTEQTAKPAPVAEIPALSGKDTAVTLDAGFVKALGTLKLTPGPGRHRRDHARPASPSSRSRAATSPTTSPAPSPRTCRA